MTTKKHALSLGAGAAAILVGLLVVWGALFPAHTDAPSPSSAEEVPSQNGAPSDNPLAFLFPPQESSVPPEPDASAQPSQDNEALSREEVLALLARHAPTPLSATSSDPQHTTPPAPIGEDVLLRVPLSNPVVWSVPPTGGNPPQGSVTQDLVVVPNLNNLPVLAPVRIEGYRNILIYNLTLTPLRQEGGAVPAALTIVRATPGIVGIASTTIDTSRANIGAVFLDAPPSAAPTRLLIASSTLVAQDPSGRVGALGWRGFVSRIEVVRSSVASNNLGLQLAPHAKGDVLEEAEIRDTTLLRTHERLEQARLLEVWSPYGAVLREIRLKNVRVKPQRGVPLGELVYPGHTATETTGGIPVRLKQIEDPSTGATYGVWNFPNREGKAAVVGIVRYE